MLVVTSKIKTLLKAAQLRTSTEFIEALSQLLVKIMVASAKKCKEEGSSTIKARHLSLSGVSLPEE